MNATATELKLNFTYTKTYKTKDNARKAVDNLMKKFVGVEFNVRYIIMTTSPGRFTPVFYDTLSQAESFAPSFAHHGFMCIG